MDLPRRFLKQLDARERGGIGFMILGVMLGAILEMAGVAILPLFVASLNDPGLAVRMMTGTLHLPPRFVMDSRAVLLELALFTGTFYLVKNLFGAWLVYRQSVMKINLMGQLGRRLLSGYLHAPYAWHLGHGSAALQHNLQHEVLGLFQRLVNPVLTLTSEGAVVVLVVGLLLAVSPVTTLIILVLVLAMVTAYFRFFRAQLGRMGRHLVGRRTELYRCLQNGLGGIKELKVLDRADFFERQFAESIDGVARAEEFNSVVGYNIKPLMETLAVTLLCVLVTFFLWSGRETQVVLPSLALFAVAALRLIPSANRIFLAQASLRFGRAGAVKVLSDLEEVENFSSARASSRSKRQRPFRRTLELKNLTHRYANAHGNSLSDISLTIAQGESVAFVGDSGAGKTTLMDLILGLLLPTGGSIRVDGRDIQAALPEWQRNIGYIPQAIYLAEESLRFNVAFGISPEKTDDARIWAALKAAQLTELVRGWPEQLDHVIGERGVRLSGGQRQRIGLARAFYHDPPVLILDEATSALDHETEREVAGVLQNFRGLKTQLIIAHRLATVRRCDRIFMLRQGRLIAEGSFEQLQRSSRDFQRMMLASDGEEGTPIRVPQWNEECRAPAAR